MKEFSKLSKTEQVQVNEYFTLHNVAVKLFEQMPQDARDYVLEQITTISNNQKLASANT